MSRASFRLVSALRVLALGIIASLLAAPLLREEIAWGLWPATYLPLAWRWILALVAAGLALVGDRLPIGWLRRIRFGSPWLRVAIALLTTLPFYIFRIQHLRWGDAYILIHAIPHPAARLTYTWQAPLDLFLHARAWVLGKQLFGWPDPMPAYWLISATAGAVFVWVLLGLALWLGHDRTERFLLVGLVGSLGLMQLFFGYIENYTLMTVGVLITIWLALRAQRGEIALVWPATALALTHAFHPSTIVLAPSLLYLAWQIRQGPATEPRAESERRPARWGSLALQIAGPYLLVFIGVVAFMTAGGHGLDALVGTDAPGGGDRNWFVPLFQTSTRWEHYTMFSFGHLLDIANEQALIAPALWPGLLLSGVFAWRRIPHRDGAFRLLLMMALLYLLLTLVWNPDYGGQRDWDLFAPAAAPAAILLGYVLARVLPERDALRGAGWALIAAQALHTMAWIYQNTLPWAAS
jgi:hypothetical protein